MKKISNRAAFYQDPDKPAFHQNPVRTEFHHGSAETVFYQDRPNRALTEQNIIYNPASSSLPNNQTFLLDYNGIPWIQSRIDDKYARIICVPLVSACPVYQ